MMTEWFFYVVSNEEITEAAIVVNNFEYNIHI